MFRQDIKPFQNFTLVSGGMTFANEGCAITIIFDGVEQEIGGFFTVRKVKNLVKQMYKLGHIDEEFTVQGHPGWVGCFKVAGLQIKAMHYVTDPDYICSHNEREFLKLVKPGYAHFVRGDGKGHYSWDSLGIRPQQKEYHVAEKWVYTI